MRSSTSGFLLLLLGAIALIGYLTGNLDRWLGYLFGAGTQPVVSVAPAAATSSGAGNRRSGANA